ncbi:MAG: formylglycine-generating enzyme family protein [Leptolyngbyaceae cyanobacterium]
MFNFETVTVDTKGNVIQRSPGNAECYQECLATGVILDMVSIRGGNFIMGSPETESGQTWYQVWDQSLDGINIEGPQHEVMVADFFMGKYPVTQAQWRTVAAMPMVEQPLDPDPADFKGDNRPIEQVSWHEAMEFCQRLSLCTQRNYRLPTEAEWEYACRAGTTAPFNFGPTITPDLANYAPIAGDHNGFQWTGAYGDGPTGVYRQQTSEVGIFPANQFGLYDMHGNVWEWCLDHWHATYEDAPSDGSAWLSPESDKRVLRGGSWFFFPDLCRSAFRNRRVPETRFNRTGFRVVCEMD